MDCHLPPFFFEGQYRCPCQYENHVMRRFFLVLLFVLSSHSFESSLFSNNRFSKVVHLRPSVSVCLIKRTPYVTNNNALSVLKILAKETGGDLGKQNCNSRSGADRRIALDVPASDGHNLRLWHKPAQTAVADAPVWVLLHGRTWSSVPVI